MAPAEFRKLQSDRVTIHAHTDARARAPKHDFFILHQKRLFEPMFFFFGVDLNNGAIFRQMYESEMQQRQQ